MTGQKDFSQVARISAWHCFGQSLAKFGKGFYCSSMYGLVKKKLALPLGKTFLSEPLSLDGFSLSDSNLQWVGIRFQLEKNTSKLFQRLCYSKSASTRIVEVLWFVPERCRACCSVSRVCGRCGSRRWTWTPGVWCTEVQPNGKESESVHIVRQPQILGETGPGVTRLYLLWQFDKMFVRKDDRDSHCDQDIVWERQVRVKCQPA